MQGRDAGHKNPRDRWGKFRGKLQMKPVVFVMGLGCLTLWGAGAGMAQEMRPQVRPETMTAAQPPVDLPAETIAALPSPVVAPVVAPVAAPVVEGPVLGPETNLPLPRYVSLKTDEGNVRRGPSLSNRIDWVYRREDLPLQIIGEYGQWRRVIDSEGVGGWMNYAMLSGRRSVLVQTDMQPIFSQTDLESTQNAILEQGVIAMLGDCDPDWCWISSGGYSGWAPKTALWGVDPDEIRD